MGRVRPERVVVMRSKERIGGGCLVQGRWPGKLRHEGVGRK